MPFELTVYRGEKSEWWPHPSVRLMCGMTLYGPWLPNTIQNVWTQLKNGVVGQLGLNLDKKVAAYAQFLRATGRPFAVATAWTEVGSFTSNYNYVIKIPNARIFKWKGTKDKPELGDELQITTPSQVTQDFLVLNGMNIETSTVLGFGHNTGTKEITFLHDLPIEFIASCKVGEVDMKPSEMGIKSPSDLSFDEKIKYRKYIRDQKGKK